MVIFLEIILFPDYTGPLKIKNSIFNWQNEKEMENSVFNWQNSAGLMPERTNIWSVGVVRSIQMLEASFKTIFMRQASAPQST